MRHIPTKAARIKTADMEIGTVAPSPGIAAARTGAISPNTLFKKLATPVPAPLTGAGNTSGVKAYSTPYMMFCEKASTQENANCAEAVLPKMTNMKRKTAETRVEEASVPRRPRNGEG